MRVYSIFDDFPQSAIDILTHAGCTVVVHPMGEERPDEGELKCLLEKFDVLIIGTGQKLPNKSFENVTESKIIGTASIGTDHIDVPTEKGELVKIVNAPTANRISVAEHTFALVLSLTKNLANAVPVAEKGLKKKEMSHNPSDLYGKTMGVIGAGGTGRAVLKMATAFGMKCLCWTKHPENHTDLNDVAFVELEDLLSNADVISINLPLTSDTKNLINVECIDLIKDDAIVISLSRAEIVNNEYLLKRAAQNLMFRVGLDVDADKVYGLWNTSMQNVIVTPHIGGGTNESRIRMFEEVSRNVVAIV